MLRPEEGFEHFKVTGLIYHFFKEVGTIDFSARNGAPNQNFGPKLWHHATASQSNFQVSASAIIGYFVC